nr:MAG: ORF1 [TTV-like mini virus]
MPYFNYRPRYYRRRWRPQRRRRPYFSRRFRTTFRRRHLLRRRRVRRKRFFRKKLKFIRLKQWQPTKIRKCKIKGHIALIQCGKGRQMNNYAQWTQSIVPIEKPGGGGFSIMVFSLNALWEQFNLVRNWWTESNKGLPLCRYVKCTWKFYRSRDTDYIVTWQTCPPFTDTELLHLNAQPLRQLMQKNKIVVPNLTRAIYKRQYIKKTFYPPAFMLNKWYFQQDICRTNLLLLTTTCCNLDQFYLPNNEISNTITLYSISTQTFHNPNFQDITETAGYRPKTTIYLWGTANGPHTTPNKWTDLIYLGQTHIFTLGQKLTTNTLTTKDKWGNPFHGQHGHPDTKIYYSTQLPSQTQTQPAISEISELYVECRYNPDKDTGLGNVVFFKSSSISKGNIWDPPDNPNLVISGYPLWLIFHGWTDWIHKLKDINQIHLNYYVVVITDFVYPKRPGYIFLDNKFIFPQEEDLTDTDRKNWYPRFEYQQYSLNEIAVTGPGMSKLTTSKSMQVNALYNFYFKWGGCPAPMQEIKDPCSQPKYPIPDNQQQRLEIEDPKTPKHTYLYYFDERGQYITKKAAKRIKKDSDSEKTLFTDGTALDPPIQAQEETESSSQTEEETEETYQQQLINLKLKQRDLKRKLRRLTKTLQ